MVTDLQDKKDSTTPVLRDEGFTNQFFELRNSRASSGNGQGVAVFRMLE